MKVSAVQLNPPKADNVIFSRYHQIDFTTEKRNNQQYICDFLTKQQNIDGKYNKIDLLLNHNEWHEYDRDVNPIRRMDL